MPRERSIFIFICLFSLLFVLTVRPIRAFAMPSENDVVLSAKNGSYQTGEQFCFSAAFSYTGAPYTPGSIEYRPVTWTITNMNIGTCQHEASSIGIELTASGNYTLLVTYNAYTYDNESNRYSSLIGNHTVSIPFTVTDSVIPNTIDVTEIDIGFLIMFLGIIGAIICLAFLRKHLYT